MTDRSTCWSITINNPNDSDLKPNFPNGKWLMQGQIEQGENGTVHYQGMLTTPQVRFSAVKKCIPRAHIEIAKNRNALQKYVTKEDTRLEVMDNISNNIPTLFDYQHEIASRWNDSDWDAYQSKHYDTNNDKPDLGDIALKYVDTMVEEDITAGLCGVEYIAINPMWRSAWKRFWKAMVARERLVDKDRQTDKNEIVHSDILSED